MGMNADGTATCTRCGRELPAYGVIHGVLASQVSDEGVIENFIFCYEGGCGFEVLDGNLNH